MLEMIAVQNCLQAFHSQLTGKHVTICGDNTTCLAYLRNQGGTLSPNLSKKAEEILLWAENQGISIATQFVPGAMNVLADQLSRPNQILPTEWTITHQKLTPVWERWGKPMIDLFATRYSKRLPLYVSPVKDPEAWKIDAFQLNWTNLEAYAFPPTPLLPKVIAKCSLEKPKLLLVTPYWVTATWYPDLQAITREGPVLLNLKPKDLVQPRSGVCHQNPSFLNLAVWKL
jgi:hypothetical protein